MTYTRTGITAVVRCAPTLAGWMLGTKAPRGPLEAAFDAARADLESLAPDLLTVRAGDRPLVPRRARVMLEADRHVAFVLEFGPAGGELTLEAPYLARVGELEPAEVRFYDHTGVDRAAEPFARLELQSARRAIAFTRGSARLLPLATRPAPSE